MYIDFDISRADCIYCASPPKVTFRMMPLTQSWHSLNTVMCLSIGTRKKIINFPFVPNGKFIILRCPKIWANYSLIIMCLNNGTPSNHHFPFGTNGNVVVFRAPILRHIRVCHHKRKPQSLQVTEPQLTQ